MNKVILIGNLTKDPELRETQNGTSICTFSIAVSGDYPDQDRVYETDFFNIQVWRERAENCGKYLRKGSKVAVIGSLQNRSYEDKDGIKRYVTDIVAERVEFLSPKNAENGDSEEVSVVSVRRERRPLEEMDDNQLPF